jgi:hypothetical protein
VLFGVQLLYLLAWIMALHPPAAGATAGVCGGRAGRRLFRASQ